MFAIDLFEVFFLLFIRRKYTLLRALSTSGELPIYDELLEFDEAHLDMGVSPHQLKLWNFPICHTAALLLLTSSLVHSHWRAAAFSAIVTLLCAHGEAPNECTSITAIRLCTR